MSFKEYFAIESKLCKQGFSFTRAELISLFTNEKKRGLSALTPHEYREFINWLNLRFGQEQRKVPTKPPVTLKCEVSQKMRRKILAMFAQMGYTLGDKSDFKRINAWCVSHGKFHKDLNAHTREELTVLVTQAEAVYKTFLAGI